MSAKRDPNTLSNYNEIRTTQVSVNFDIDFSKKRLSGNVILKMKGLVEPGCKEVVLDTRFVMWKSFGS
jgi:leukotriene-A4 hydrolase